MIKITGPMLILVMTAVFLFLAATNIQVGWLYMVDALLWSVIAMAVLLPFLQLRRLQLKRRFPASTYSGQSQLIEIELSHSGRWPLAFVNVTDLAPQPLRQAVQQSAQAPEATKAFISSLNPGQKYLYQYQLTPQSDGVYLFPGIQAGSFGPLGLVGLYWKQAHPQAMIVRPLAPERVIPLISDEQELALKHARRRSHHSDDVSHFREYQPGDNKRSIHWKNSAKRQKLIVAEAREEPFQQALVLVDTFQTQNKPAFHALLQQAKAVCHSLLEQKMEIFCFAQNADPAFWQNLGLPAPTRSLQNVRDWDSAGYWLATLEPDSAESLQQALLRQGLTPGEQLVVLISTEPDPELLRSLCLGRSESGLNPLLVFASPGYVAPTELASALAIRS